MEYDAPGFAGLVSPDSMSCRAQDAAAQNIESRVRQGRRRHDERDRIL
jgi:hypothetical protein